MKYLATLMIILYEVSYLKASFFQSVFSSEIFILPLSHHNFSLSFPAVDYRPSIAHMPDLPSWLQYSFSARNHLGYVYGVPPETTENIQLEVIATDRDTYQVKRKIFDIDIQRKKQKNNEVKFKITNFNVEDLLVSSIRERLLNVFLDDIWPDSKHDLVVTSLKSASDEGDQLPLDPQEREGCYISVGSNAPFSVALKELEQEAKILWNHRPCPKYFKKTSYERFFRRNHFAIDWCSFRLFTKDNYEVIEEEMSEHVSLNEKFSIFSSDDKEGFIKLIRKDEVEVRSFIFDVIYTILVPLAVMVLMLTLLTFAMCCHSTNIIPKAQEIQMVHYANVTRASDNLRTLGRDHSPHPSLVTNTTQVDTLPRSRTGSPASTARNHSLRRYEDYATLHRPNPPPYQRNGSTPTRFDDE